jgi:intein/homing endonuclease
MNDDVIDTNAIRDIKIVDDQPAMDGWDEVDPTTGLAGFYVDPEGNEHQISLEDSKALGLANDSLTDGVFQFDTPLAKQILQNGVKRFEDLMFFSAAGHPGPMQCCWSESMINTITGYKRIKDLNPEYDEIVCITTDMQLTHTKRYKVIESGKKRLVRIKLSNGSQIMVSLDHKVLTSKGYIRAEHLTKTDLIACCK